MGCSTVAPSRPVDFLTNELCGVDGGLLLVCVLRQVYGKREEMREARTTGTAPSSRPILTRETTKWKGPLKVAVVPGSLSREKRLPGS
jgi:hypothetical protein